MNLVRDMFRVGPAPTLGREATLFVVSMVVLAGVALWANSGEANPRLLIVCAAIAVHLVGRLVYRIANPAPPGAGGPR